MLNVKKVFLLIPVLVIGFLIGIFLAKYNNGNVTYCGMESIDLFLIVLLLIVVSVTLYGWVNLSRDRRNMGQIQFKIYDPRFKLNLFAIIFYLLVVIFSIYVYIITGIYSQLLLALLFLINLLQISLHQFSESGIGEKGIIFGGDYYNWSNIKAYKWISSDTFEIQISQRILFRKSYKKTLKCKVKLENKNIIEGFLERHVGKEKT